MQSQWQALSETFVPTVEAFGLLASERAHGPSDVLLEEVSVKLLRRLGRGEANVAKSRASEPPCPYCSAEKSVQEAEA